MQTSSARRRLTKKLSSTGSMIFRAGSAAAGTASRRPRAPRSCRASGAVEAGVVAEAAAAAGSRGWSAGARDPPAGWGSRSSSSRSQGSSTGMSSRSMSAASGVLAGAVGLVGDAGHVVQGRAGGQRRRPAGRRPSSHSPRTTTSALGLAAVCSGSSVGCTPPHTMGHARRLGAHPGGRTPGRSGSAGRSWR